MKDMGPRHDDGPGAVVAAYASAYTCLHCCLSPGLGLCKACQYLLIKGFGVVNEAWSDHTDIYIIFNVQSCRL